LKRLIGHIQPENKGNFRSLFAKAAKRDFSLNPIFYPNQGSYDNYWIYERLNSNNGNSVQNKQVRFPQNQKDTGNPSNKGNKGNKGNKQVKFP